MKFIYLFICFLAIASTSFAQKTKTVEIVKRVNYKEYIDAIYILNNENKTKAINIRFACQNYEYQHISDLITLYYGSPSGFYKFLNEIEVFYKENEPGVSQTIQGHDVEIKKGGKASVWIYEKRADGDGYYKLSMKSLAKFKTEFVDWCKKNNVAYE